MLQLSDYRIIIAHEHTIVVLLKWKMFNGSTVHFWYNAIF